MMEKVSTQETRSYAGELRIEGDERESQVLKEYDGVYRALLRKGQEFRLELPPLFKNNFIDHGSLTSENRTNSATKTNLNTFLQFLERSELYELLVPCTSYSKGNGYKVNSSDSRIPSEIKTALNKCSQTYSTTEEHKSVRRRFLDIEKLDPALVNTIAAKVLAASNSYDQWLQRRVTHMHKDSQNLAKEFQQFCFGLGSQR